MDHDQHSGHEHSGHEHSGHEHSGHDHSGHEHSGHEHSGHGHGHGAQGAYVADFDLKAADWDDPGKVARARQVADAIVAATSPGPTTRLFEYGAGTGLVTEALGDRVGPALLADTSAGMREVMATKVADGRLAGARITDVDLAGVSADLPDERFDLVVTVLTLHHVGELDRVLGRFAQLLDPGGHLCVVDLDAEDGSFHGAGFAGHHGFDRQAFGERLRTVGFDEVTVADCGDLVRDDGTFSMFLAVGTPAVE